MLDLNLLLICDSNRNQQAGASFDIFLGGGGIVEILRAKRGEIFHPHSLAKQFPPSWIFYSEFGHFYVITMSSLEGGRSKTC